MRLLIVEDNFLLAFEAEHTLSRAGHVVVGCTGSPEDALRAAREERPQLALLDVQLRGSREGLALSHELHASLGVRSLLVTANCPIGRIAKDGALGCLSKPFSSAELVASVKVSARR